MEKTRLFRLFLTSSLILLTITYLGIWCKMMADPDNRKEGIVKLSFELNPFHRRSIGPLKGIEATIQNQASHVVTAIGSAVTAASIPFEASAGITQTCVGIAAPCHDTGSNFLFPIIAMGFGLTFVVVSILCQLWPKKSILLSAVSFMSSLLAWTLSTLLLGITQELYNTAQHVKSRTDGNLEHGFIYTGSLVNFILICLHLLSSIGMFIMDFNEYIPYNNGNQYQKSDNGGGWKKLQEYETQGIQQLASVWKRS